MYGDFDRNMQEVQQRLHVYQQFDPIANWQMQQGVQIANNLLQSIKTKSPVINIEDATTIEIGNLYNVLVARGTYQSYLGLDLPLIGPLHDDAEIPEMGASAPHFHLDWRFFPDSIFKVFLSAFGRATGGAMQDLPNLLMHLLVDQENIVGEPERRKLRCARQHSYFKVAAQQPWLPLLEKAYEGKKVECDRCPHRGFSLVGAVEDAEGNRFCAGHGLCWSKQGELVRRTA